MVDIVEATEPADIEIVRRLFREYQQELNVDLCFQDFNTELRTLPGAYAHPQGRLFLAIDGADVVGCIALRSIDSIQCEMKRLYVRAAGRGLGVGRLLVERAIEAAKEIGYTRMLLDTLPIMTVAQRMYEQFGFRDVPAYRPNPVGGTRFLGLELANS